MARAKKTVVEKPQNGRKKISDNIFNMVLSPLKINITPRRHEISPKKLTPKKRKPIYADALFEKSDALFEKRRQAFMENAKPILPTKAKSNVSIEKQKVFNENSFDALIEKPKKTFEKSKILIEKTKGAVEKSNVFKERTDGFVENAKDTKEKSKRYFDLSQKSDVSVGASPVSNVSSPRIELPRLKVEKPKVIFQKPVLGEKQKVSAEKINVFIEKPKILAEKPKILTRNTVIRSEKPSAPVETPEPPAKKFNDSAEMINQTQSSNGSVATVSSSNYGKEMESLLKTYCTTYHESMNKKRQKLDKIAVETIKENENQMEKIAKRHLNERKISREEFQNLISEQVQDCREQIKNDEINEAQFKILKEQLQKQCDTMQNSRQVLLEKILLVKNTCQNYVKVLDELDEEHDKQFEEFRVSLRHKLTSMQSKMLSDSQKAELLNMRKSMNKVIVSPMLSSAEN